MHRLLAIGVLVVGLSGCTTVPPAPEPSANAATPGATPVIATATSAGWEHGATLTAYFGRNAAAHPVDPLRGRAAPRQVELVSEADWDAFHRDVVLPRLLTLRPEGNGFTLHDATGHWQSSDRSVTIERNKVVTVVVPITALPAAQVVMAEIAAAYARRFHQEAVLLTLAVGQHAFQGASPAR